MSEWTAAQLIKERPVADLARMTKRSFRLGGLGIILTAVGFFTVDKSQFLQSYLIGYLFWMGITIGSLLLLMVQYLSGGAWGQVGRRIFEASAKTLPLMAVLFLPIAFNLETLFLWARPEAAADPVIHAKAAYLNKWFFFIRAALYFVVWYGLTVILTRWSTQQDMSAPQPPGPMDRRFRVVSGPGLVAAVLAVSFMSVDWVMSLDPHFYSTIFGILTLGGAGLSTLAFTILVLYALSESKPMSQVLNAERFHDFGKLMLAFTMLWAYFNVSQLLIIWSANLPEEIPWYIERLRGPWLPWSWIILLGHFVLPFVILLSRDIKRRSELLQIVALFVLLMRLVDFIWTIGPVFRHEHTIHWLDFCVVLALLGPWLFMFCRNLGGRALVPANDPYFKEAVADGGH